MEFSTPVRPAKSEFNINHAHKLVSLGSCFSENIGKQFKKFKFDIVVNPFGQQYNPISISKSIRRILANIPYRAEELFEYGELYHSYDHHSEFSNATQEQTLNRINDNLAKAHTQLLNADVLFLTFGTAHVFSLLNNDEVVSNCHKLPAKQFNKRMLDVLEIEKALLDSLNEVKKLNLKINIVLTVSPVRYFAFGIEENTLSKSLLFVAIHSVIKQLSSTYYFPAYEIVMDELRDYRFYAEDMLHPNYQATNYVWEKLQNTLLDKKSIEVMKEIEEISRAAHHKPRNGKSKAHRDFQTKYTTRIHELVAFFPHFDFAEELRLLGN